MTPENHSSRHDAESPGLILMYHRIVRHEPAGRFAVTLEHFEEHLRVLMHRGYTILPLATLATSVARRDLPARAVAITFDDGYIDYLEETIQVLTRYAAPSHVLRRRRGADARIRILVGPR